MESAMSAPYSSGNADVKPYVRAFLNNGTADFSTDTQPTLVQVTNIISQVDGEIDGALTATGTTGVSSTGLQDLLKKYSAMGSAGLTMMTYGENEENFRKGEWFYNKFEAWIDNLINNDNYKEYIYNLENGEFTNIYASNQFIDGTNTSTEIQYIDEDFKG
jgi:hypothetical protein